MKPEISIEKIAKLSRLTLDESESERLYKDLLAMIDFVGKLPDTGPSGSEEQASVFREDITKSCLPREELLSNAPDRTEEFFRVPRTVKGD